MRKQEKTIIAVIGIDGLSVGVKFALASVTGSLSLLADSWHSISDLTMSILVLLALMLDRRGLKQAANGDSDQTRPGIIRRASWEPRVCGVIGIALIAVAVGVFRKVYLSSDLTDIRYPLIAFLIVLFLILLSYIRYRLEEAVGKETVSPAMVADAYHSWADMYVLILVLGSFVGEMIQIRIDRWVAGFIAIMIFVLAVKTVYRSLSMMFQASSSTHLADRTVEDTLIVLTMGGLYTGRNRLLGWLAGFLDLRDPPSVRRLARRSVWAGACLGVLVWFSTGLYLVTASEVAIVERFGRAVNLNAPTGPGLHLTWPYPISRVRRVDTRSVRWMRLGYQTKERKDLILWTNAHYIQEYALLSGDGAIIDLAANLHYRVTDPAAFLYAAHSPVEGLAMISNQVLREMAGTQELFSLLTREKGDLERGARKAIQALADQMNLGIEILHICLLDMHPPVQVAPAFEDVVSAQEDLETSVEEARGYEKEKIPQARAEAVVQQTQAQAYGTDRVQRAIGQTSAFAAVNIPFRKYDTVSRYRMRMDSLETSLKDKNLWIVDSIMSRKPIDLFVNQGGLSDVGPVAVPPAAPAPPPPPVTGGEKPNEPK